MNRNTLLPLAIALIGLGLLITASEVGGRMTAALALGTFLGMLIGYAVGLRHGSKDAMALMKGQRVRRTLPTIIGAPPTARPHKGRAFEVKEPP